MANTGYGWGSDGITYSEALMRNYTLMLMKGTSTELGQALMLAKQRYYSQTLSIDGYDEKVILESTFYGLPMTVITTAPSPACPTKMPANWARNCLRGLAPSR